MGKMYQEFWEYQEWNKYQVSEEKEIRKVSNLGEKKVSKENERRKKEESTKRK